MDYFDWLCVGVIAISCALMGFCVGWDIRERQRFDAWRKRMVVHQPVTDVVFREQIIRRYRDEA